jgi:hypothetical protein
MDYEKYLVRAKAANEKPMKRKEYVEIRERYGNMCLAKIIWGCYHNTEPLENYPYNSDIDKLVSLLHLNTNEAQP